MPTYTAHFYTEADWAETTIEAATPELALQRARQIESEATETLDFQSYDGDQRRRAYRDLGSRPAHGRRMATATIVGYALPRASCSMPSTPRRPPRRPLSTSWTRGDLAGAVRELDASIAPARMAIAKAKGGAS